MAADQIGAMEFCDKRDALLRSVLVDLGRHRAERELKLIETLRNSVAHAGAYARNPANALNVIRAAKLARCWIDRLERLRRDAGRHVRAA